MVDAYKIARDASELVVDVQKSDTVLGKVMGRIFAFASVPRDVAETHTKKPRYCAASVMLNES
jgi:hypothetical protein